MKDLINKKVEQALKFHDLDDLVSAEQIYKDILTLDPSHAEALHFLGLICYQRGKYSAAIDYIEKAILSEPKLSVAHNSLGLVFSDLRRADEAVKCFESALEINPNLASAHNNLANILRELGKYEESIVHYQLAIDLRPNYAKALNNFGIILDAIGKSDEAEAKFVHSIKSDSRYAEPHYNLGTSLLRKNRIERAIVSLKKAVCIDPGHADAWNNLGNAHQKCLQFDEAIFCFTRARTQNSDARILECIYSQEKFDIFEARLSSLIDKDPKNLSAAAISAFASHQLNKRDPYPFCSQPLDFLEIKNCASEFDDFDYFLERLIAQLQKYRMIWEPSGIATKFGFQTKNDLFLEPSGPLKELYLLIKSEIISYYNIHRASKFTFIRSWPEEIHLKAWFVKLLENGYQEAHIHPDGWLSGIVYLKTSLPESNKGGGIEFSLNGNYFPILNEDYPSLCYQPRRGDLVLFPSSLFHKTIPVQTNEERLSIAFDMSPG